MPQPEPDADTLGARRVLIRAILWSAGGMAAVAAALYAAFWLPHQNPGKAEPRALQVLPPPKPGAADPADPQPYTWVDREAGIVRIPVEDAMELLTGKLPVRPGGEAAQEERRRGQVPTDAGSGRRPARGRE